MAFYSGFFNSKGLDRTYTAEDFTSYLSSIICNGILDTYGQMFRFTAASSGLKVTLGTGKAWIDGHYFINDARYSIDLTSYQDESLPRYVAITILLDVGESVRSVSLEITPGTPAENPSLPSLTSDENKTRLLMYAVRLNPDATELTERDWYDYREDKNVCGYCKCILGKCKVTELMSQMAQLITEVQENNETMEDKTVCNSRTIHEELLQQAFVDALNEMIENSDGYLSHLKENLKTAINLCNPQSAEALAARMNQLQQELIDRTESRQNYDDLVEEILLLREQQEQTNMDEAAKAEHRDRIQALCNFINSQPRTITNFDGTLVRKLLKDVKVCDVFIEFRFKSGTSVIIEK